MGLTATIFFVTMSGVTLSMFGLVANAFIPTKEVDRRLPLEKLIDKHDRKLLQ